MTFVIALEYPCDVAHNIDYSPFNQRRRQCEVTDAMQTPITNISIGDTRYPMRQACVGTYFRALEELSVQGVSPHIVGKGKSAEEASNDFCLKVHATLQSLINKRPFEMTDEDQLKLDVISQFIDVTVYQNTTPIKVRQFGRIRRARPYPESVAWDDGRVEQVPIDKVEDSDYVTYRSGQPFEAVVQRDPITFELIRIVSIERRHESHRMPAEEESQLLDEIGSLKNLRQNTEWTP